MPFSSSGGAFEQKIFFPAILLMKLFLICVIMSVFHVIVIRLNEKVILRYYQNYGKSSRDVNFIYSAKIVME